MELLIVVVGVSIAFQLNVWNDSRKKHAAEGQILQNFIVENTLNQVDSLILEGVIEKNSLLIELLSSEESEADSIRLILADLYSLSWADLATTHLDNYLEFESETSPLNEEMLLLKTNYSSTEHLIEMYLAQKQEKYSDYLSDVVDISNGLAVVDREKLYNVQFRNNLVILYFYEKTLLESYRKIAESQKKTSKLIEEQ